MRLHTDSDNSFIILKKFIMYCQPCNNKWNVWKHNLMTILSKGIYSHRTKRFYKY